MRFEGDKGNTKEEEEDREEEEDKEGHGDNREDKEEDGKELSAHLMEFVFEELSPPATGHTCSWSGQVATPTDCIHQTHTNHTHWMTPSVRHTHPIATPIDPTC